MEKKISKNIALILVSSLIVYSIFYLEKHKTAKPNINAEDVVVSQETSEKPLAPKEQQARKVSISVKAKTYPKAKEFVDPTGFINTDKFSLSDVVGKKVVLIDFWTYSCINCQRTLPYLKAWNDKYKDKGLVIIGVHTPEFDFEKNYENVVSATKKLGVTYPVVLDSNRGTWTAYNNQYWPREYLIDIDGYIVHDHIGEGDYDVTEHAIQDALKERSVVLGINENIDKKIAAPADAIQMNGFLLGSPETYFGGARNEYLANGTKYSPGTQTMSTPDSIESNKLYLGGMWDFTSEFAESKSMNSTIIYKYKAKNVYFVASSKYGVKAKVMIDGKIIDPSLAGKDVDVNGEVLIKENRLYDLVHGADYGEHTLTIEIEDMGLDAYTFTFG